MLTKLNGIKMARNVTNVQKRGLLEIYIGLNLLENLLPGKEVGSQKPTFTPCSWTASLVVVL